MTNQNSALHISSYHSVRRVHIKIVEIFKIPAQAAGKLTQLPAGKYLRPATVPAIAAAGSLAELAAGRSPAEAYVLWVLGCVISALVIRDSLPAPDHRKKPAAWVFLITAVLLAVLYPELPRGWAVWLGLCSVITWRASMLTAVRLSIAMLIFSVFVPSFEYIYMLLGFPLSRISASLTVFLLHAVGIPCGYDNAIIFLGTNRIAVTAACSGIELLTVLLLLGWLIVYFEHKRFHIRLLHYLTLLPLIILCNSLRLVFIISLSLVIGEKAFGDTLHMFTGCGVVIASTLLLVCIGPLFNSAEKS